MRGVRSFRAQKSGWLLAASVTVQGRVWQWFQSVVQTTQPAFTIQEVRVTQLIPDLTARPCARGVGKQSSRDMRQKWELQSEYRVTQHVVSIPLLSDVKVGFRKLGFLEPVPIGYPFPEGGNKPLRGGEFAFYWDTKTGRGLNLLGRGEPYWEGVGPYWEGELKGFPSQKGYSF